MRIAALVLVLAPFSVVLAGCAAADKTNSDREWQRAECNRIIDKEARERCVKRIE